MPLLKTPVCEFNTKTPDFTLRGVDGETVSLSDCKGEKGLLVVFICNHCPYVKAILPRLVKEIIQLQAMGIGCVTISSNDPTTYPEDSFENMQLLAKEWEFTFPYLFDETQEVANAFGAVCTPDFFGYNSDLFLQYRGRMDELLESMKEVVLTGKGPEKQIPSQGCSIKWRVR